MRFRFCGDLDCPDWVLAEINTLSKLSSVKVKMLCQIVAKYLTGNEFDEDKAKKLVTDAKMDLEDMKACVAALVQIMTSSARHGVEEDVLNSELQQLGLPKEHAAALGKVYNENSALIADDLRRKSFRTSTLEEISCVVSDPKSEKVEMNVRVNDRIEGLVRNDSIFLTFEQLAMLLTDLKWAREKMKSLPS